ncbi:hypothetical protein QTP70_024633, partial [Hemibagrus guttatus]
MYLSDFQLGETGSVHLRKVDPLSAMVFPFSSGPSGPGCPGTDVAMALPVCLSPGSSAHRSPSQSVPCPSPPSSSGSSLARSSLKAVHSEVEASHLVILQAFCTLPHELLEAMASAFNTIIPQQLIEKLSLLGLNTSLFTWILDFLTGRPQLVWIRNTFSSTTTLSTGAPQGCVLSPLLFTLLTRDCAAMHSSNHIVKFTDDTTVVGLISKNDKEHRVTIHPLFIDGSPVEIVKSTKFLGGHLLENFTWSLNTSSISKKAQQHLYFLRSLMKAHLPPPILTMFYRGTIKIVLSSCITAWFGNCTVSDHKTLQRIVKTAEKIIGVSLPSITDMYTPRCIRKGNSIVDDPTHSSPSACLER